VASAFDKASLSCRAFAMDRFLCVLAWLCLALPLGVLACWCHCHDADATALTTANATDAHADLVILADPEPTLDAGCDCDHATTERTALPPRVEGGTEFGAAPLVLALPVVEFAQPSPAPAPIAHPASDPPPPWRHASRTTVLLL
jgi:hypothetical protein